MEKISYICRTELNDMSRYPWILQRLSEQTLQRIHMGNLPTWIYAEIFRKSFSEENFDESVNRLLNDSNYVLQKKLEFERRK